MTTECEIKEQNAKAHYIKKKNFEIEWQHLCVCAYSVMSDSVSIGIGY